MNVTKQEVEKYIKSIVNKYKNRGIKEEILFDAGMKEAVKVIKENKNNENFNIERDYRFNWFVRQAIIKKVNEKMDNHISKEDVELINKYFKSIRKYKNDNDGIMPEDDVIINNLGITLEKLKNIRDVISEYNL